MIISGSFREFEQLDWILIAECNNFSLMPLYFLYKRKINGLTNLNNIVFLMPKLKPSKEKRTNFDLSQSGFPQPKKVKYFQCQTNFFIKYVVPNKSYSEKIT